MDQLSDRDKLSQMLSSPKDVLSALGHVANGRLAKLDQGLVQQYLAHCKDVEAKQQGGERMQVVDREEDYKFNARFSSESPNDNHPTGIIPDTTDPSRHKVSLGGG